MQKLPESFVKEGLRLAEGSRLFGKAFADMSRDELIASAAQGWSAERKAREDYATTADLRAAYLFRKTP